MSPNKAKRIAAILVAGLSAMTLGGCKPASSSTPNNVGGVGSGLAGAGGCIPVNQPISFTGTGVYFDWNDIIGGQIPGAQAVGQMYIGGNAAGGPYTRNQPNWASIRMSVTPAAQSNQYGYNQGYQQNLDNYTGPANITGVVQLSQLALTDLTNMVASGQIPIQPTGVAPGYGYGNGYMPQPVYGQPGYGQPGYGQPINQGQICVSQIAVKLGHYHTTITGSFPGAGVYLYLNNSQHGYRLTF